MVVKPVEVEEGVESSVTRTIPSLLAALSLFPLAREALYRLAMRLEPMESTQSSAHSRP